jgi:hypothetical protein
MLSIEELLDTVDTSELVQFNKNNFLIYCNFMMFDNDGIKTPPDIKCEEYYRRLFKHIEMLYEDQIIQEDLCSHIPNTASCILLRNL